MPSQITTSEELGFRDRWGTGIYDYKLNSYPTNFQDLMITIAEQRAITVEGEVGPLSVRMRERNSLLQKLGTALAEASNKQAGFKSDDDGDKAMSGWFSDETSRILNTYCREFLRTPGQVPNDATKAGIEGLISKLKSIIDGQNNASQTDMTRLQSLVDRRDESFSTATTLMTNISESRDNAIRNL